MIPYSLPTIHDRREVRAPVGIRLQTDIQQYAYEQSHGKRSETEGGT